VLAELHESKLLGEPELPDFGTDPIVIEPAGPVFLAGASRAPRRDCRPMERAMKPLNLVTLIILIVGGLSWGLVGFVALFGEGSPTSSSAPPRLAARSALFRLRK
jgi:hypothetical protein